MVGEKDDNCGSEVFGCDPDRNTADGCEKCEVGVDDRVFKSMF